jgi:isoleucyl-tRNA synthetase
MEDFVVCKEYDLPVISPVNAKGVFTGEGGISQVSFTWTQTTVVLEELDRRGHLMSRSTILHQYPHCWRCKKPVFFRATEQWFASIDGSARLPWTEIRTVRWIPGWGEERIYNMVANRGDWCISRQRSWGVPIPYFIAWTAGKNL